MFTHSVEYDDISRETPRLKIACGDARGYIIIFFEYDDIS